MARDTEQGVSLKAPVAAAHQSIVTQPASQVADEPSIELADDLAAVATTMAPPIRPASSDSTQPLTLSQVEQEAMSAIARVNDAVLAGVLESPVGSSGAAPTAPAAPTAIEHIAADVTLKLGTRRS